MDQFKSQHEGTEHLAINNTFTNRFLTLVALKTTARFYSRDGFCVPISPGRIVKTGPCVHLTEAATMKFVAENTSLPVPKIHWSFVHKHRAYIVMERIPGEEIPRAWRKLRDGALQQIFAQLKQMLQELRALKPTPGTGVESCVGGSIQDSRIPRSLPRFGPFQTIQEFHRWLREDLHLEEHSDRVNNPKWQEIKAMVVKQDGPWPAPVFTHGDLNPSNILVRGNQVVGLLDWEFAGWYPHYWEYTSAWYGNITRTEWQDLLDKFLEPFPEELKMEITRQKWWGEF